MKILHVITSLKIGGAEVALHNLLESWQSQHDRKHDHAVIFIYGGPFVEKIRALGVPVYYLKGLISPYDLLSFYRLFTLVKTIKPDVIHSALWSANIMARIVSWWYKIPVICDLHGDCAYHGAIRNFFERATLFVPARFVAVAHSVERSFVQQFCTNKNVLRNTIVIQNGIDSEKLRQKARLGPLSRQTLGFSDSDFVIGSVGRLHAIKRYDLLIRSFAQFSKIVISSGWMRMPRLCLVGDGPERLSLEKAAHECSVSKQVFFAGAKEDAYRYYNLFDCFALSSQTEGLSIALLEALSFFLPVIITHNSLLHDVITDGIHGILLPVNSFNGASLESKIASAFLLFYKEKGLLDSMRKSNEMLMQEKFCIRATRTQYDNLYGKLYGELNKR
ncbi:glycosyltransferase [Candidatus Dependentiae bacterium]|nr:glycosyltransferase [Candidatus Dependentiae bacterium]